MDIYLDSFLVVLIVFFELSWKEDFKHIDLYSQHY